jgi:structure-specific endonuclease subunit SLX1
MTTTDNNRAYFVYLLASYNNDHIDATYVGATIDLDHRLRQHNGEIKGGAHATSMRTAGSWKRYCYVTGFPTWQAALQFEWRWKQVSRGLDGAPLKRRLRALQVLLGFDKPTTAAVDYASWAEPPEVVIETDRELPIL